MLWSAAYQTLIPGPKMPILSHQISHPEIFFALFLDETRKKAVVAQQKARKSMAVVLLSKRERGQDRMIVHDSDVGRNTRHDRIDMPFNFNT